jgi:hypothetical protein
MVGILEVKIETVGIFEIDILTVGMLEVKIDELTKSDFWRTPKNN